MAEPISCVECGASIPVLDDDPRWSIRTEVRDGVEVVVERHVSLICGMCGRSETRVQYDPQGRPYEHEDGSWFRFYNLVVAQVDPPVPLADWSF